MQSQSQPLLPLRRDHIHDLPQDHLAQPKTSLKVCLVVFVVMALVVPLLSFITELSVKALSGQPPFASAFEELRYHANYKNAAVS